MWNEKYNTDNYIYGKTPNEFLVSIADQIPRGRALSIGEGEGRNAVYLAKSGFRVAALDLSEHALHKATLLAKECKVEIETNVADLNNYKIEENSFDLIISMFCHVPPELRKKVHRNILLALKPGGVLVMELFSKAQIHNKTGGPKLPELLLSLEELEKDFCDLNFYIKREIERDVFGGTLHTGKSSVVQIYASKGKA